MSTTVGSEYDHIDFTQNNITTRHPLKDATSREMVGDIVKIQDTAPQLEHNKIWIKETPGSEIQVPTYDEFGDLKSAIGEYGYTIPSAYNSDLNEAKDGWVRYGSSATNQPDSSVGFVLTVTRASSGGIKQQIAITDNNLIYSRHLPASKVWDDWVLYAKASDITSLDDEIDDLTDAINHEENIDFGMARYTGAYPFFDDFAYENGSLNFQGSDVDTYHKAARVRTKGWSVSAYDFTVEAEAESNEYDYKLQAYLKDNDEDTPDVVSWGKTVVIPKGKLYRILMVDVDHDTTTYSITVNEMLKHFHVYANEAYKLGIKSILDKNPDAKKQLISLKRHTHNFGNATANKHLTHSDMFCIAHISDVHVDGVRYQNFIEFCDFYKNYIDARICTGDFVSVPTDDDGGQTVYMRDIESTKTVLWCCGNHERSGGSGSLTKGEVYDQWQLEQWYEDTDVEVPENVEKPLYYYKDYTKNITVDSVNVGYKIRLIVLNCCDKSTSGQINVYGTEQINWLTGVLQDAAANDYAVIIATHFQESKIMPGSNTSFYCRKIHADSTEWPDTPIIENLIDDFRRGNGDFSESGSGQFLAWMVGHSHNDHIGYSQRHPDQLILQVLNGGLHRTAYDTVSHIQTFFSDLPRVEGEKSEDAFNVYSFDPINKLCKVMRVGSDLNDMMVPREVACFETEPTVT